MHIIIYKKMTKKIRPGFPLRSACLLLFALFFNTKSSSQTLDMIKSSSQTLDALGLEFYLEWRGNPSEKILLPIYWRSSGSILDRLYQGPVNGTLLGGKCKIFYPGGYFEGTIKPLNLATVFPADLPTFRLKHIPANSVEVIEGGFFYELNDKKVERKIKNCNLAKCLTKEDMENGKVQTLDIDNLLEIHKNIIAVKIYKETAVLKKIDKRVRWLYHLTGNSWTVQLSNKFPESVFEKIAEKYSKKKGVKYHVKEYTSLPSKITFAHLVSSDDLPSYTRRSENEQEVLDERANYKQRHPFYEPEQLKSLGIDQTKMDELVSVLRQKSKTSDMLSDRRLSSSGSNSLISEYPYAYFGNASIRLIDEKDSEIGSYSYIYDHEPQIRNRMYYEKSLVANVVTEKKVSRYEVYCDNKKVGSSELVRSTNKTSYENANMIGTLLGSVGRAVLDNIKISSFEAELLHDTQINKCYYELAPKYKNAKTAASLYDSAIKSIAEREYGQAFSFLDAALSIENDNEQFVEQIARILHKANLFDYALSYYQLLLKIRKSKDLPLAETYRETAVAAAKAASSKNNRLLTGYIYDEQVLGYLVKASSHGDEFSLSLLQSGKGSAQIVDELRNQVTK